MIRRRSSDRRGFTLIEMMLAALVGAVSVLVAAKIAQLVIAQTTMSKQRTDLGARAQLAGRQLRADIRNVGLGSSGAVAVDPSIAPFSGLAFATPGGSFPAMPVIAGANALAGRTIGDFTMRAGSDAVQVVVANPVTRVLVSERGAERGSVLPVESTLPLSGCPMIYIADHSAPSGTGRAHLALIDSLNPDSIIVEGALQFTVAVGSEVMCARISTYWIDTAGWMHRNDLLSRNLDRLHPDFPVYVDLDRVGADLHSPGVEDFQIAYRVSAEAYRFAGRALPAAVEDRWAFAGAQGAGNLLRGDVNRPAWFEVRQVRFNLLERTLRKVGGSPRDTSAGAREDGADVRVFRDHTAQWTTTAETLANLRFFDLGAPEGVPAEPY